MADWELFDGEKTHGPHPEWWVIDAIGRGMKTTVLVRQVGTEDWKGLRSHAPFAMTLEQRGVAAPPTAVPVAGAFRPQGEVVFTEEPGVTITSARAILHGVTYPLANITSVRAETEDRPLALVLIACLFLLIGFLMLIGGSGMLAAFFLMVGGVLLLIYFAAFEVRHWVRIGTAGTESNALYYKDRAYTQRIVDALNRAIVHRG